MTHTGARPATHTNYSAELATNVRGVHGHEGYCTCGWTGRAWKERSKAVAEARWHLWEIHGGELAARKRAESV